LRFYFRCADAHDAGVETGFESDLEVAEHATENDMTTLTLHTSPISAASLPDSIAAWRDSGFRQAWQAFAKALREWFDAWTDPRAEVEAYLARAQNLADLENRMLAVYSRHGVYGGY
jgi:hypothetical protein